MSGSGCCGKCGGHKSSEEHSHDHSDGHSHEHVPEGEVKRRPRKATLLNMQWLKERLAKMSAVREKLQSGAYSVDSEMLAKAVLNKEK